MILVVGDVMLDRYFWGMATRLSPEAPVPIVQVVQVTATLGGAGNVAANLVGLNHEVVLVGACGKDPAADALTHAMREYDRQQITRIDEEKIKELFNKGKADIRNYIKKVLPKCKAIIVSDYAKGVVDDMLVSDILKEITLLLRGKSDIPIFVDPKGLYWAKYKGAYCVTPNLGEFMAYWHSQPRDKAIDSETQLRNAVRDVVVELELEYMVVTRGGGGILVIPKEGQMHQLEVEKRGEVADVTGAGDTVIASLASQMVRGARMEDCAEFANEMAGIVVSRLGTSPITREDTK
jgi:D-beta-D-heptose 7-phosphate kinase/D-beta-D-heptose 1-phosphate adenosyltransferase